MNRQGEYGRVRVWDTESWVANSDDRVAAVIASMRAMGQDRTAGIYAGNVFTSQKPRINGQEFAVAQVWAAGAAVAASQQFIGQRAFKNGLPWVFVFDGLPGRVGGDRTGPVNPDDGTVVIVGDLGASYDKNRTLFRSVALAKNAQMDIADGGGRFVLHDFYGNPMPAKAGRITVPLNDRGFFLRTDGSAGSFGSLLAALAQATIVGLDPVEIVACDLTAPVSARPKLRLKITNVLNRPVKGNLTVTVEGLTVEPAQHPMTLAGNETREVDFTITGGTAGAANNYKLLATFEAGQDGVKKHAELVHANVIAGRTITPDGNLADWQGTLPQTSAQTVGVNASEKAYLPFQNWDRQDGGGTEIFCLQRPGMMRKHFFPRQPKASLDGGPVKGDAKLVVKDNIVECAIPWSELPEVKARRNAGQTVKFSFRVNNGGSAFELAAGRSVSKDNPLAFHNDWSTHWANEVEFGFER